jgi:hypothetical protein
MSSSPSTRRPAPAGPAVTSAGTLGSASAYFVYHVTFYSRDIPESVRGLRHFPRSEREIWVWKRQTCNVLLATDPKAQWEKHEARVGDIWNNLKGQKTPCRMTTTLNRIG